MKLFAIAFFIFFITSNDLLSQDSDSLKCWSSKNKLKWNDFRDDADTSSYLTTLSFIRLHPVPRRVGGVLSYKVMIYFVKYGSRTKDTTSDYLLSHEHFDIGELYARKLRRAILDVSTAIKEPTALDFTNVINRLYKEFAAFQTEFDDETFHGLIEQSQREWANRIYAELEQLKKYSGDVSDCD